jgi:hypothetical protein
MHARTGLDKTAENILMMLYDHLDMLKQGDGDEAEIRATKRIIKNLGKINPKNKLEITILDDILTRYLYGKRFGMTIKQFMVYSGFAEEIDQGEFDSSCDCNWKLGERYYRKIF